MTLTLLSLICPWSLKFPGLTLETLGYYSHVTSSLYDVTQYNINTLIKLCIVHHEIYNTNVVINTHKNLYMRVFRYNIWVFNPVYFPRFNLYHLRRRCIQHTHFYKKTLDLLSTGVLLWNRWRTSDPFWVGKKRYINYDVITFMCFRVKNAY